jgi:hypothetical protein
VTIHDLKRWLSLLSRASEAAPVANDLLTFQGGGQIQWKGYIHLTERSSDPSEPAEGEMVIWMSDGTGKGDDGDVMVASKAGGTTNYGTLFDHSGGAAW